MTALAMNSADCSEALSASVLSETALFSGVRAAAWEAARKLCRTCFFRDGETICGQGDPADSMLLLWNGEVAISRGGVHLVVRGRGDVVGEQGLIEGTCRSATMTAKGLVQLIVIPTEAFGILLSDQAFTVNLLRALSRKLTEATRQRAFRFAVEELLFTEFKAHVARPVLDELLATGEGYGRPRVIDGVVLFSDIRAFSCQATALPPERLARELGGYLNHAVDVAHRHAGLVDKFIGDAVMVIWGWPKADVTDAVHAALRCAQELVESASRFSIGDTPVAIGVGLNAGPMFIGNVGSGDKRQFTVLGHTVNMAARYESATKELNASIVMGPEFFDRLDMAFQEVVDVHPAHVVKGAGPHTLYSLAFSGRRPID